jgi:hypothetical protein
LYNELFTFGVFIIFAPCDGQLLKSGNTSQHGSSDPGSILSLTIVSDFRVLALLGHHVLEFIFHSFSITYNFPFHISNLIIYNLPLINVFPPERTIAFTHSFYNSSSQLYKASKIIYCTLLLLAPTNSGLFTSILLETDFCSRVFDFGINGNNLAIGQLETFVLDLESVEMLEGSFMDFGHHT